MANKNKVDVRIQGKDYRIVGEESEEYIQRIALFVDKKMNMVSKNSNNKLSTAMVAVLTAINVVDDYFKNDEQLSALKEKTNKYSKDIDELRKQLEDYKKQNDKLRNEIQKLQMELVKRKRSLKIL